jgi:hypothetical protein
MKMALARLPQLKEIAHDSGSFDPDLIAYRMERERIVERCLPTKFQSLWRVEVIPFHQLNNDIHIASSRRSIETGTSLVRVHS